LQIQGAFCGATFETILNNALVDAFFPYDGLIPAAHLFN
jgi:hypothetical protein